MGLEGALGRVPKLTIDPLPACRLRRPASGGQPQREPAHRLERAGKARMSGALTASAHPRSEHGDSLDA
jgi:hypothetical protein